jgi:hypothetical protein
MLGLMAVGHDDVAPLVPGVGVIRVRDLGAAVRPAPAAPLDSAADTAEYDRLLDALSSRGAILPAPPGLVFRTADTLRQWLEQNYVGLAEGLAFLSGRCEARVHVRSARHGLTTEEIEQAGLEAADALRALQRGAVATVTLAAPQPPVILSVAYLVKATDWGVFSDAVLDEERRYPVLRFDQTGPWIPHDFVRLDFGA